MHRAFRRAWWAPAVVYAATLVAPATAQPLVHPPADPPGGPQQGPQRAALSSPYRGLEIQIEMAWLADPITFPYQLAAHVTDAGIEVFGYVPSAQVRDQALKIAGKQAPAPLLSELKIAANLPDHTAHCKAEWLQYTIINHLKIACPGQAAAVKVACNDQGHVELTGTVASREDKLAIAQHLRQVTGCTSVASKMRIAGEIAEPDPASPPRQVGMETWKRADAATTTWTATNVPAGPKIDAVAKLPETAPPSAVKQASFIAPALVPNVDAAPVGPQMGSQNLVQSPQAPVAPPQLPPLPQLQPTPSTSPYNALPPVQSPLPAPVAPLPTSAATSPYSAIVSRETWTPPTPVATTTRLPATIGTVPPAVAKVPVPSVAASAGPVALTSKQLAGVVAGAVARTPLAVASAPANTHVVPVAMASKQSAAAVAAPPAIARTPTPLGDPYVTTGVVLVTEPEPMVMTTTLPPGVKQSVERVCGPRIANVVVEPQGGKSVKIQYTAHNAQEAEQFWQKIQAMPELLPFDVHVEVHMAH